MTLDTELVKTEVAGLPECYLIQSGDSVERFTTYPTSLVLQGNTYRHAPIQRTGFTVDVRLGSVKVTIAAPLDTQFGAHIANTPIEPTVVTIYRAIEDSLSDFAIIFKGTVMAVSYQNRIANAVCERKSSVLLRSIPNVAYQSYCNHQLFDIGCTLNYADYLVNAQVLTIGDTWLPATEWGSYDNDYFQGGYAVIGTDMRMITAHTDTKIWVHVPFDSRVQVGTWLECYPGCLGSPDTCKTKFDNFVNFRGFPYIPSKNPVVWSVA